MYWQWYAVALVGAVPGFVLARRWWTLFLAPLPFVVGLIAVQSADPCKNAEGDCYSSLGWMLIATLLSIGWALGAVAMIALRRIIRATRAPRDPAPEGRDRQAG
jgi:hypothetical protein